ncbi:hypothetical protein THOB06_160091 [Vibrio rotiferianus]|nr:hypothetical protein THOG10_160090 [Vibrio rotiferianus]CAH1568075.1 hypothetical protein THOB06_160091 [Vibrio rotiferianus]
MERYGIDKWFTSCVGSRCKSNDENQQKKSGKEKSAKATRWPTIKGGECGRALHQTG